MGKVNRDAYLYELARVAKNLGLPMRGNTEFAIMEHCRAQMTEWVKVHGKPKTLTELMDLFASSLDMEFFEVHSDDDLESLFKRIPIKREPVLASLSSELDDSTDALTLRRSNCDPWERRFLAVINCRGWHGKRVFFSKWHELTHRILEGQQLRMAFRKTKTKRPEPEEVLVDRVAASLAYYPSIFEPIVNRELDGKQLSFNIVDQIRGAIAPEASFEATTIACLKYCQQPVWFAVCCMGYKREEEARINSKQMSLLPDNNLPKKQLRVRESGGSPAAKDLGIALYENMRVPDESIVTAAFQDAFSLTHEGNERLELWQTSSGGPIGYGEIKVEAFRYEDEVWALLTLIE